MNKQKKYFEYVVQCQSEKNGTWQQMYTTCTRKTATDARDHYKENETSNNGYPNGYPRFKVIKKEIQ